DEFAMMIHGTTSGGAVPILIPSYLLLASFVMYLGLYYLLEWLRLDELSKDSAVPGLDREDAYKRIAAVPPLPEQTAIVRFLDWAERRILRVIRARQRQIKLLEEYKQALIHQAVTGKIDIRTGQPYPAYKPSGVEWLCEVPAHWEILPLKWLAKCYRNGATPPTTKNFYYMGGTIPWYSPSSFDSGEIVSAPIRFVSNAAIEDGVARLIHGPALLVIVIGATAGRMTLMEQDGTTNQQITAFELPYDWKTCVFLLRQLRFSESWLRENASTATIPILNTNIVTHLPCLLPPPKERCAIVEYLDAQTAKIDAVIAAARREIELLREYRERLIADVVTGKVDVREIAARLPEEPLEEGAELAALDEAETLAGGGEDEENLGLGAVEEEVEA
ncbi:restriction endonuclease subunit S, partial [Meiothermus taiwanensis]